MYITEVILDGFKSYATRTVVSGFDQQFNAITGLNGSGKSNILDAICFVLGISNLGQVRVSSLQELVYKQGQAGVTKASVTIVFNNEDRKASPVGYEQYDTITVTRQIVIGGRNKYLINGHNAQLQRVQNLFHSVQLNVNNPHFLIMQGRITKVLNMKPQEILGMIEEAAGTRMFEAKKQQAINTIEKKEKKVEEIKKVLAEEITPTLEALRKERTAYIQWKNNEGEIERRARIVVAHRYQCAEETLARADEAAAEHDSKAEAIAAKLAALKATLDEQQEAVNAAMLENHRCDKEAAAAVKSLPALSSLVADDDDDDEENDDGEDEGGNAAGKKRKAGAAAKKGKRGGKAKRGKKAAAEEDEVDDEDADPKDDVDEDDDEDEQTTALASGDALRVLEARATALGKLLAKAEAALASRRAVAKSELAQKTALQKALSEGVEQRDALRARIKAAEASLEEASEAHQSAVKHLEETQRKYQAVSAGLAADEGGDGSLAEQLRDAERRVADAQSARKKAKVTVAHLSKEVKKSESKTSKASKELVKLREEAAAAASEAETLRKALADAGCDTARLEELTAARPALAKAVHDAEQAVAQSARSGTVAFDFDRRAVDASKVRGPVAELVRVPDARHTAALEVAAGGRLFNVVVDDAQTGKSLLEKGKLQKRTTLLPLDKIQAYVVPEQRQKAAADLVGQENVALALNCVQYDDAALKPAMSYVFGQTLVCADSNVAKAVAFDERVRAKCVTLQGDQYDPAGTLTGGSRKGAGDLLPRLAAAREARDRLDAARAALATADAELAALRKASAALVEQRRAAERAEHKAASLAERVNQNAAHQAAAAIDAQKAELAAAQEALERAVQDEADAKADVQRLNAALAEAAEKRQEQLAALDADRQAAKTALSGAKDTFSTAQQNAAAARLELEQDEVEAGSLREQMVATQQAAERAEAQAERAAQRMAQLKEHADSAANAVQVERARRREAQAALNKLHSSLEKSKAEREKAKIEQKALAHAASTATQERIDAKHALEALLQDNDWIVSEKQFFGKKHTDYDFSSSNMKQVETQLARLREQQTELARSINKKVMSMFEKAEAEYQELTEKKRIIINDKAKIEAVIAELDEKKADALRAVWKKVTVDFGSIFSALLPGASAKLEPPEGMSITEGLEIRVAFNDVWKNLGELSGGQRSLLALSLILSLLLFKPAPMYILDEIDAALDLSHTQNIGLMLKKHFTHSQFIIVSLKEGMFKNANVVFRTKFVDGVSQVTRHTQKKK